MSRALRGLARSLSAWAFLLTCWSITTFAQDQPAPHPIRPLLFEQNSYRLHAGDRVSIATSQETLNFVRAAKTHTVTVNGAQGRGFVVGPSVKGDQVLLAAPLTMKPGEYAVTVSAVSGTGEERSAVVDVTLDPMRPVPSGFTAPPVVLLNGWQFGFNSNSLSLGTCPISSGSSDTFGSLETQLTTSQAVSAGNLAYPAIDGAGAPVVYFFDNCVEDPNGLIENLGNALGEVINLIRYDNGTLVPQMDLVSHSMGGLIVRSYLSGLQTNGALSPPANPRVRKFIEIATPNFGSFFAANWSDVIPKAPSQTAELIPGSPFLWSLATWNQRGDDLRGVDALAIIGNAGYWQANNFAPPAQGWSDGVVSLTSASLGFASLSSARNPSRTRIVPYAHIPPGLPIDCTGACPGIAKVDQAPETGAIVLSFLENTADWESIGNSNQTQYGGLYFALENAAGTQYEALASVSLGSVSFQVGQNNAFFFDEFAASGTATLAATNTAGQGTNCGSFSVSVSYYSAVRCKYSPSIYSVQSNLSTGLPGVTVASSSTITINGTGFSNGTALLANGAPLSGQIVTAQEITAFLPSSYGGLVTLAVSNSTGVDAINIVVAPPALPPAISLSPTRLQFSYSTGGAAPVAQTVTVANSGGGTLTWSAASSSSWLTVSPSSSVGSGPLTLGINTAGLTAQTYNGTITVSATGATNSAQKISVTLTVTTPAPSTAPVVALVANAFGGSSVIAPNTWIAITGSNLAPAGDTRVWQASDFVNNQLPTALDGVSVTMNGQKAYVYYVSGTQINALTPPNLATGTVQVQVTNGALSSPTFNAQAQPVSPSLFVFDSQGHVVAQHLPGYTDIGPTTLYPGLTTPAVPGQEIVVYGNGFGSTTVPVVAGSEAQSGTLQGTVKIQVGGASAQLIYAGLAGAGVYQFNVVLPASLPSGDVPISVLYNGQPTQASAVIAVQQ
jgi:uncharacterized protein (TIGR03437 family)